MNWTESHLNELDVLGHECIVQLIVDVYPLQVTRISYDPSLARGNHTSIAQQLCPELKKAPSTSSATV
jgi:hypothetical protein